MGPSSYNQSEVIRLAGIYEILHPRYVSKYLTCFTGTLPSWQPDDIPYKSNAIRKILLEGGINLY